MSAGYKLDELATRAGVSPRTVRYYVQRGLLPAPAFRGPDTAYDEGHLVRLRAIRALQDAYWPLDAIASVLAARSLDEIRAIADGALPPSAPHGPAPSEPPIAPPVARPVSPESGRRGVRYALVPGVELFVDDDATEEARVLVESIRALSSSQSGTSQSGASQSGASQSDTTQSGTRTKKGASRR